MRLAKTILAAAALALASGVAFAKDEGKEHKGFNDIDKNADGHITKAEATAAGRKDLLDRWSEADTDKDGKLSRAEYLKLMAKEDANKVKEKVSKAPAAIKKETQEAKRRAPESSSTGSTSAPADSGKPQ